MMRSVFHTVVIALMLIASQQVIARTTPPTMGEASDPNEPDDPVVRLADLGPGWAAHAPYLIGLNDTLRPIPTGTETDYFGPFGAKINVIVAHLSATNAFPTFEQWAAQIDKVNNTPITVDTPLPYSSSTVGEQVPPMSIDLFSTMSVCPLFDRTQFAPTFGGMYDIVGVTTCLTDDGTFIMATASGKWANDLHHLNRYIQGVDAADHVVALTLALLGER